MRRLTLILSDLYLPEEAERGVAVPPTRHLPHLEWLLRFADSPEHIADWRQWLLEKTVPGLKTLPVAAISAYERIDGRDLDATWLATPVALEARLDHVRLLDRGLLRLNESERESCREEFSRVFGPQYLLHDGGERAFFLSGLASTGEPGMDPARIIGMEIGPALPGRDAGEMRRLWAEIEMWLHGATFNSERTRAGKQRVSALWLWGARATPSPGGRVEPGRADAVYFGGDPLIVALNRFAGGRASRIPEQLADLDADASHVVVEFAALTGEPHESLEALDANWLATVKSALVNGNIREVDVLANNRRFRIGARPQRKFWRRSQPWLARLGS
jgi:hypothetical protein